MLLERRGHERNEDRLYIHSAFLAYKYQQLLCPSSFYCDDFSTEVSAGDFWKVFVR